MAKYLKIQSLILCVCMLISAMSGLSVIAADPLELVSWDADADFITLDFNQAIDVANSSLAIMHDDTYLTADEYTIAKADINANVQADGISTRYTYKVTLTDGIVLEDEYTISFENVVAAEGESVLEHRDLTFAVYELADDADLVNIVPYKWGNSNTWVRDTATGGMMIPEFNHTSNNMSYWSVVGARVGDDTTDAHKLPTTSLPAGSANWTEKDYTVKATIKVSNMLRGTVNFGIASDTQNMHGETAAGAKYVGIKTYDYAAMTTTDHDVSYYLMKNSNNRTSAADRAAYFTRTSAPSINPEAGFEFKVSSKDGVVRAFMNGQKLMDGEVDVLPGYPFASVYVSSETAGTKAKVQMYDFQVTQVREIFNVELDKTEDVEVRDTLNLTFSSAIDPETKDSIKVLDAEGNVVDSANYTVELTNGDTVAEITFVERLAYETDYTIDISGVKMEGIAKATIKGELAFRTKDLPPQSPELMGGWDADFEKVTITFTEEISEFEATLKKDGVEVDVEIEEVEENIYTFTPADGLEEGATYKISIENISNADDTKALLFWEKVFAVKEIDGSACACYIVEAELEEVERIDIEGELDITFDTEIDEATIEGIKLYDSEDVEVDAANYTVSLSDDKLTATIQYAGLEYESAYKIAFEGIKVYEEDRFAIIDAIAFTTKVEPIGLEEIFVDWNADLDFITLEFNVPVSGLDALLTQGNSTIPVEFEAAAREDMDAANSSRYTYKLIPEGGLKPEIGYTLSFTNVDAETEVWADDEKTIHFKVELLDEGFVDPKTAKSNDTYVYNGNGVVTQAEDGKGLVIEYSGNNRARTMIAHAIGSDSDASLTIGAVTASPNSGYTHKEYTFKATFKNISGTSTARIGLAHTFAPVGSYTYDHGWFRGIGTWVTLGSQALKSYSKPIPTSLGDTDGDGATNYDYNVTTISDSTYSGLDGEEGVELKLAMKGDRANFYINGGKMFDVINHINRGAAALYFEPTASTASDAYCEIADIVITRACEIVPAEIDTDVDVDLSGQVVITLDEAIDVSKAAKIKLVDSEGNEAEDYEISLASDGQTITVSFNDLAYKTVYHVDFSEVVLETGNELANVPFMTIYPPTEIESFGVVGGGEIEGTVTLEAVIKNNTDPEACSFTGTIAIYNSKGQMVAVVGGAYTLETGEECTISLEDFECDPDETYTAKCFIWESFSEMTERQLSLQPATTIGE